MADTKCRYMTAAYPTLGAEDTCTEHEHNAPTFALAKALAAACYEVEEPTDEAIAWFLNDAAAVIGDIESPPLDWTVSAPVLVNEPGLDMTLTINGVEYVIQQNDSGGHVESHPITRAEWDEWTAEAERAAGSEEKA